MEFFCYIGVLLQLSRIQQPPWDMWIRQWSEYLSEWLLCSSSFVLYYDYSAGKKNSDLYTTILIIRKRFHVWNYPILEKKLNHFWNWYTSIYYSSHPEHNMSINVLIITSYIQLFQHIKFKISLHIIQNFTNYINYYTSRYIKYPTIYVTELPYELLTMIYY